MEVQHRLRSPRVAALAPTLGVGEDAVLVRRLYSYAPEELYPVAERESRLGAVTRLRPHAVRKALNYAVHEGYASTVAKVRTAVTLGALDLSRSACSFVGVVEGASPGGRFKKGEYLACAGFRQPLDAEVYRMHPDQCTTIPAPAAEAAGFLYVTWLLGIVREQGAEAVAALGLGTLTSGLRGALAGQEVTEEVEALPHGRRALVLVAPTRASEIGRVLRCPGVERVVLFDPLGESTPAVADPRAGYVGLPDSRVLELDPFFPGPLDWPPHTTPLLQREVLAALVGGARAPMRPAAPLPCNRWDTQAAGKPGALRLSVAGCGNFARAIFLHHAMRAAPVELRGIFDVRGDVALAQARALGSAFATTDFAHLTEDAATEAVLVTSDHASHARYAIAALSAGKGVHIEKPPTITEPEMVELLSVLRESSGTLSMGFNRPFTPAYEWVKGQLAAAREPIYVSCSVKGFRLPRTHWYYWPTQGTRIAGNMVHWIDLCCRVCEGRAPTEVQVMRPAGVPAEVADNATLVIVFDDGSMASISFTSAGSDVLGVQEYVQIRSGDVSFQIDNFERIVLERSGVTKTRSFSRDKGHRANATAAMQVLAARTMLPGTIEAIIRSSAVQFAAQEAFATASAAPVRMEGLVQAWGGVSSDVAALQGARVSG